MNDELSLTCRICGAPLAPPMRGPMPEYCPGSTCRTRAWRMRKAGVDLTAPRPFAKIEPDRAPRRLPKPSREHIASLFLEARRLEQGFRQASTLAPDYRLRPLCSRMADALGGALKELDD